MDSNDIPESSEPDSLTSVSQFSVPKHILQNLTPVKAKASKTSSKHRFRRDSIIGAKTDKLKTKSIQMNQKLSKMKLHQTLANNFKVKKLMNSLELARNRRKQYIELVRQRAQEVSKKAASVNVDDSETFNALSLSVGEIPSSTAFPRAINISDISFLRNIDIVKSAHILQSWESYSFRKAISIFTTDSPFLQAFVAILHHLQLDSTTGKQFRLFFYSFILISDLKESLPNFQHPGFNVNCEDFTPKQRFFNNFIWVLLYKESELLTYQIKCLILTDNKVSLLRIQQLHDTWARFVSIFKIFKTNHSTNLKSLLRNARMIVNKQIAIAPSPELINLRTRYRLENQMLLHSANYEFDEKTVSLIKSINDELDRIFIDPTFHLNHIPCDALGFRIGNFEYRHPCSSIISLSQWRKYWFKHYMIQKKNIPKLRTGSSRMRKTAASLTPPTIKHIGEVLNASLYKIDEDISEKDPQKWFSSLAFIYEGIPSYLLASHNPMSTSQVNELTNSFDGKEPIDGLITLLNKLPLLEFPLEKEEILKFLQNINDKDNRFCLIDKLQELKVHVANWWIYRCQFRSFKSFQIYENTVLLLNNRDFMSVRFNIYTKSPSIVFREFYKQLQPFVTGTVIPERIIQSCLNDPQIFFLQQNDEASAFFTRVWQYLIVYGTIKEDELNISFVELLKQLNEKLDLILKQNCWILLFENYYNYGVLLQTKIREAFETNSMPSFVKCLSEVNDMHRFSQHYDYSYAKIYTVLQEKLLLLLQNPSESILRGNFYYCEKQVISLLEECHKLTAYIYQVYCPVLNWIYDDLGIKT